MRYVYVLGIVISCIFLVSVIDQAEKIKFDPASPWRESKGRQTIFKPNLRKASLLIQRYKLFWQKHKTSNYSHNDRKELQSFLMLWKNRSVTDKAKKEFFYDAKRLGIIPYNRDIRTSNIDDFESFIYSH